MSMFTLNAVYCSVTFDSEELQAIRSACEAVATRHHEAMDKAAEAGQEEYFELERKANRTMTAGTLTTLFKPDQEVLIEKEDLEPVLVVLREHRDSAEETHVTVLDRAISRIENSLRTR